MKGGVKMEVKILKRYIQEGGEGPDFVAIVKVVWPDGKSLKFVCRNIVDVGYVINPAYKLSPDLEEGGVYMKYNGELWWFYYTYKRSWFPVRPLTEREKEAVKYLEENPPVYDGIRI